MMRKANEPNETGYDVESYCVYLNKTERIVFEKINKIFIDVGGNLTIFSEGVCVAAFPHKAYLYCVKSTADTEIEIVDDQTN